MSRYRWHNQKKLYVRIFLIFRKKLKWGMKLLIYKIEIQNQVTNIDVENLSFFRVAFSVDFILNDLFRITNSKFETLKICLSFYFSELLTWVFSDLYSLVFTIFWNISSEAWYVFSIWFFASKLDKDCLFTFIKSCNWNIEVPDRGVILRYLFYMLL